VPPVTLTPLTGGNGIALTSARPGPDLAAAGWSEVEYAAAGSAPLDRPGGRGGTAFTTRVLLRRPESAPASGVLVVEWLNVSSGADAAPDWTYLADELVRQGHAWAGVSAQYNGVESGSAVVAVEGAGLQGLKAVDPVRYGGLHHPGDRHAHAIFTEVARAVAAEVGAGTVLAIGESQSAYLLTTHVNQVHLDDRFFAGYLIHSRGDVAAPAGEDGCGIDLLAARATGVPTPIRDDLDVPVLVLQTEGDLLGRMNYLPARQPDGPLLRVWEVAGAAHADLFQIGDFEAFLGCPDPVNRGQQVYVARAALRHLVAWAQGGPAAPAAPPLEVRDGAFVRDEVGNVRGGVRTPVVDAPVEVLAGDAPGGSVICGLFGRTLALAPEVLHDRWGSQEEYAAAYTAATDAAVTAGFVLPEDRAAVLGEMRTLS
jgi:hypothetical protein